MQWLMVNGGIKWTVIRLMVVTGVMFFDKSGNVLTHQSCPYKRNLVCIKTILNPK